MMFLIPVASVVLFLFLWRANELSQSYAVGGCILVGLAGQLFAPVYSLIWIVGLLLNAGVAISLAIRLNLM